MMHTRLSLLIFAVIGLAMQVHGLGPLPGYFACGDPPDTPLKDVAVRRAFHIIDANRQNPDFVVIDVRREDEYAQGHIPNAININFKDPGFGERIDSLDKTKTYLVYCVAGYRSKKTQRFMRSKGFTSVINMKGGIMKWKRKKYPIETM